MSSSKFNARILSNHKLYSKADYLALHAKGYTDAEILEIWNADLARGAREPNSRKDLKFAQRCWKLS